MEAKRQDLWTAPDKICHVIFCSTLTVFFSLLAVRTNHPLLRRHAISTGAALSLLAGAGKEAADHLGYFNSSGASAKDAVADVVGVVFTCALLSVSKLIIRRKSKLDDGDHVAGVSLV